MTYEEAKHFVCEEVVGKNLIVRTMSKRKKPICGIDAIKMCVEALEKQIPKKPTYKEETSIVFGKHKAPYCPCCGDSWNFNEFGESMKYCWECGQAIDWSEEE